MIEQLMRDTRSRAGLSLRALARRAGTSPATLRAYEQGSVSPGWNTVARIIRAAGFEPIVDVVPQPDGVAYPLGDLVVDMTAASDDDRLRLVIEFVDRWNETTADRRIALVHDDPGSTGDARWDALVAGLAEHLCWHAALAPPDWVGQPDRYLDGRWWPVDLPSLRAQSLGETPASLARHGVMLSRRDLERV